MQMLQSKIMESHRYKIKNNERQYIELLFKDYDREIIYDECAKMLDATKSLAAVKDIEFVKHNIYMRIKTDFMIFMPLFFGQIQDQKERDELILTHDSIIEYTCTTPYKINERLLQALFCFKDEKIPYHIQDAYFKRMFKNRNAIEYDEINEIFENKDEYREGCREEYRRFNKFKSGYLAGIFKIEKELPKENSMEKNIKKARIDAKRLEEMYY
jgi:hypothetical protein